MPVNFGQPVNAGVARSSAEAQSTDGHGTRSAPVGPQGVAAPQVDGLPLVRRNAGTAGANSKRATLSEIRRASSRPLHPDTVAAEVCGDAISGRLSMTGRYFSSALTSAVRAAVKGMLPLM